MAKILLWVETENEPILQAFGEVKEAKKKLEEAIYKLERAISEGTKTTPVCDDTSVETEE